MNPGQSTNDDLTDDEYEDYLDSIFPATKSLSKVSREQLLEAEETSDLVTLLTNEAYQQALDWRSRGARLLLSKDKAARGLADMGILAAALLIGARQIAQAGHAIAGAIRDTGSAPRAQPEGNRR